MDVKNPWILTLAILIWAIVLLGRFFYLQVIREDYKLLSFQQSVKREKVFAPRGNFFDRNNRLIVASQNAYDIFYLPYKCSKKDKEKIKNLIGIEKIESEKNPYQPVLIAENLLIEDFSKIYPEFGDITCVEFAKKVVRRYNKENGAHVLGYISRVDSLSLLNNPDLEFDDLIGKTGLEKFYDNFLRGKNGVKFYNVDALGRKIKPYKNGAYDITFEKGYDFHLTIDIELQEYGEYLMKNKRGSIIAIEPETGEILVMVSAPSYNPSLLTGNNLAKNFQILSADTNKPLINRALQGAYPPGSAFKIANALIALQLGRITPNYSTSCIPDVIGCHKHPHPASLKDGIKYSCNGYFYKLFSRILQPYGKNVFEESHENLAVWQKYMLEMGFGVTLDLDYPYKRSGFIPGPLYYDKIYGYKRWAFSTIYSLSIGQGEVLLTPLHLANFSALLANKGKFKIPHLIKKINAPYSVNDKYEKWHYTSIDKKWFDEVEKGLKAVIEEPGGTAYSSKIPDIVMAGKTGTAQNPHGEDHAVFFAYAPVDSPKIAISVIVENAGFGGVWAAPIASLMIEKYLKGKISRPQLEERIVNANLLNVKPKSPPKEKKRKRT